MKFLIPPDNTQSRCQTLQPFIHFITSRYSIPVSIAVKYKRFLTIITFIEKSTKLSSQIASLHILHEYRL